MPISQLGLTGTSLLFLAHCLTMPHLRYPVETFVQQSFGERRWGHVRVTLFAGGAWGAKGKETKEAKGVEYASDDAMDLAQFLIKTKHLL